MLLAIDTGNTNTVFAVFDDAGGMIGEWRSSTNVDRTADEIGVWLSQLFALQNISRQDITSGIIATVVPATLFSLRKMFRRYFHCQALVVGAPDVDIGIGVIVDIGTATTFDVIDEAGNYLGGAIAPGVNLSLEALHRASAQLPRVAIGRPERVIGKTTVQAMRSGIFWGYVGMIEGTIERIRRELGKPVGVISTGGLAPLFSECSPVLERSDPHLTLKGLYAVYRRNNPR